MGKNVVKNIFENVDKVVDKVKDSVVDNVIDKVKDNVIDKVKDKVKKKAKDKEIDTVIDTESDKEIAEEPAKETVKEIAEETAEKIAEEPAEENAKEIAEETAEKIAEEPAEEIAEEPAEEIAEEIEDDIDENIETDTIGNVLVIGNSGVGKSTLINSVIGEEITATGWGTAGTTSKLEIYEREDLPFRIIDTIGFEPSYKKEWRAINAVRKWSRESAKERGKKEPINVIWFCVDGTSNKLFPQTLKNLYRATSMWENAPVIVVITKSYSENERPMAIKMVKEALALDKKYSENVREILPVVAQPYVINENAIVPPFGTPELIEITNNLMPEGIKAAEKTIKELKLNRKRMLAQRSIAAFVAAGAVVGAVPIPISDGEFLSKLELTEINALAAIYGINKDANSKALIESIVETGTVGTVAHTLINALKMIPVINIAASVLNAVAAGAIVAALGEGAAFAFEKIYLGENSLCDIEGAKKIIDSKGANGILEKVNTAVSDGKFDDKMSEKDVGNNLLEILFPGKKQA